MTYRVSTGLRNYMLATGSMRQALQNGKIMLYTGPEPASADDAATGTLLCTIDKDGAGAGFTLDTTAVGGVIAKVPADVLRGTVVASGTPGYYRHVGSGDTGAASTTEPRVQGRIAQSGAEGNITNLPLVSGSTQDADEYSIALPTF
jgi:hypothetical protein